MAANTNPIFTLTPNVQSDAATAMAPTIVTATGDYTGVSANHAQVFKAGANGAYIERIRLKAVGSNVATVARVYLNNNSTHTSAANNSFVAEMSLPIVTASNTAATGDFDIPLGIAIPANFSVWVGLGTTVASGYACTPIGGDY